MLKGKLSRRLVPVIFLVIFALFLGAVVVAAGRSSVESPAASPAAVEAGESHIPSLELLPVSGVAALPQTIKPDEAPPPSSSPLAVVAAAPALPGGKVVVIDPGHAASSDLGQEPIGPGSSQTKVKDPGGTSGVASGVREAEVTLAVSRYLKEKLEAEGFRVIMTRNSPDFNGGNRERAMVANQAGAGLMVRIHCDGAANASVKGASTLYPAPIPGWTDDIFAQSKRAAEAVQAALVGGLGVIDHGTVERSDITGFNWADTPVILTEVGFMSNAEEDLKLNTPAYQQQVAGALFEGIRDFLS